MVLPVPTAMLTFMINIRKSLNLLQENTVAKALAKAKVLEKFLKSFGKIQI